MTGPANQPLRRMVSQFTPDYSPWVRPPATLRRFAPVRRSHQWPVQPAAAKARACAGPAVVQLVGRGRSRPQNETAGHSSGGGRPQDDLSQTGNQWPEVAGHSRRRGRISPARRTRRAPGDVVPPDACRVWRSKPRSDRAALGSAPIDRLHA